MGLAHVITTIVKSMTSMFQMVELHDFKTFTTSGVTNLKVSTSSTAIELVPTDEESITIELKGLISKKLENAFTLNAAQKNETLDITVYKRHSNIMLGFILDASKLVITAPRKWFETIDVETSSGSIESEGLTADAFSLNARSGSVKVKDLDAKSKLAIVVGSGSIKAANLKAQATLSLQTSSGSITAEDIHSNKLNIKAKSGSLNVQGVFAAESTLHTSSGSINARDVEGSLNAEASSGSIKITNKEIKGVWSLRSSSGGVTANLVDPGSLYVKFQSGSGSGKVNLFGFNYEIKSDHAFIGQFGTGDNKLHVKTGSGGFRLS